jgi:hypothetical protein
MSAKRLFVLAFFVSLTSSFLLPQTLTEIAQKERERRAALKGKKATVVTNANLAKLKKKPALETPPAPPLPATEEVVSPEGAPAAAAEPQEALEAALPPTAGNPVPPDLKALQERYEKTKEYVELLTLKMGALWQQFYSLEDMTTKDALQQSIAETFLKLQKAQEDETLARQDLEKFLGRMKKDQVSPIWVR